MLIQNYMLIVLKYKNKYFLLIFHSWMSKYSTSLTPPKKECQLVINFNKHAYSLQTQLDLPNSLILNCRVIVSKQDMVALPAEYGLSNQSVLSGNVTINKPYHPEQIPIVADYYSGSNRVSSRLRNTYLTHRFFITMLTLKT